MVIYGHDLKPLGVAPVIKAPEDDPTLTPIVVVTAQHREMLRKSSQ